MPPLNVPLWHVEYLELKAVKTQQPQEKLLPPPNCLKKFRYRTERRYQRHVFI